MAKKSRPEVNEPLFVKVEEILANRRFTKEEFRGVIKKTLTEMEGDHRGMIEPMRFRVRSSQVLPKSLPRMGDRTFEAYWAKHKKRGLLKRVGTEPSAAVGRHPDLYEVPASALRRQRANRAYEEIELEAYRAFGVPKIPKARRGDFAKHIRKELKMRDAVEVSQVRIPEGEEIMGEPSEHRFWDNGLYSVCLIPHGALPPEPRKRALDIIRRELRRARVPSDAGSTWSKYVDLHLIFEMSLMIARDIAERYFVGAPCLIVYGTDRAVKKKGSPPDLAYVTRHLEAMRESWQAVPWRGKRGPNQYLRLGMVTGLAGQMRRSPPEIRARPRAASAIAVPSVHAAPAGRRRRGTGASSRAISG